MVDQLACPMSRCKPAKIGKTVLGDDDRHVMLGVVDVADHRHKGPDAAVLRRAGAEEDRQEEAALAAIVSAPGAYPR